MEFRRSSGFFRGKVVALVVGPVGLVACGPHLAATPAPAVSHAAAATTASSPEAGLHMIRAHKRVLDDQHSQPGECHVRETLAGPLPDPACTPGAIDPAVNQSNIRSTICTPGYTATVRPPASDTDRWKHVAEQAYGLTGGGEYDHLVSLELGGANATSNLWPEPGTVPNAKDAVENRLHKEVCNGSITLAAAQEAIARDWTRVP